MNDCRFERYVSAGINSLNIDLIKQAFDLIHNSPKQRPKESSNWQIKYEDSFKEEITSWHIAFIDKYILLNKTINKFLNPQIEILDKNKCNFIKNIIELNIYNFAQMLPSNREAFFHHALDQLTAKGRPAQLVTKGQLDLIKLLISFGANPEANDGSCIIFALLNSKMDIIEYYKEQDYEIAKFINIWVKSVENSSLPVSPKQVMNKKGLKFIQSNYPILYEKSFS